MRAFSTVQFSNVIVCILPPLVLPPLKTPINLSGQKDDPEEALDTKPGNPLPIPHLHHNHFPSITAQWIWVELCLVRLFPGALSSALDLRRAPRTDLTSTSLSSLYFLCRYVKHYFTFTFTLFFYEHFGFEFWFIVYHYFESPCIVFLFLNCTSFKLFYGDKQFVSKTFLKTIKNFTFKRSLTCFELL